jgi:HSP20 family protein
MTSNKDIAVKKSEGSVTLAEQTRDRPIYAPQVDIMEKENDLVMAADLPGVSAQDVEIHYEDGLLTIQGKVEPRQQESKTNYLLREYGVGDFYRSFRIGSGIEVDKILAEIKHGVLMVHLPKAEALRPRKITVQAK